MDAGSLLTRRSLALSAAVLGLAGVAGSVAFAACTAMTRLREPEASAAPRAHASVSSAPRVPVSAEPRAGEPQAEGGRSVRQGSVTAPASRYGALEGEACEGELRARRVPFVSVSREGAPGVDRPVRLTGPMHGVVFHGDGLAKARTTSVYEIADCRLALALDDLARALAPRGIVEVIHFSMHRPAARPATAARAGKKPGKQPLAAKPPAAKKPSQHELGLAIDVAALVRADGTRLTVLDGWPARIGDPPCAEGPAATPTLAELREIVCGLSESQLFNVILTPNANEEHRDHLHLDITRGATWFLTE